MVPYRRDTVRGDYSGNLIVNFRHRFCMGKLRPRIQRISGVVRFVHSFRNLRYVTTTVAMVHTGRLFDRTTAHTHHQLHKVVERKSNYSVIFGLRI